MKCKKCGAELKPGAVFCSKCGLEVQMVPDYNVMEDDITAFIGENVSKKKESLNVPGKEEGTFEKKTRGKKGPNKKLIAGLCIGGSILILIGVLLMLSAHQKNTSFSYQYQRGTDYMENGLYDKARVCLKKALKLKPEDENAMVAWAKLYLYENNETEAINTLLDAVSVHPDSTLAYKQLIAIYEGDGDYASITKLCKDVKDKKVLALFSNYIVKAPVLGLKGGDYQEIMSLSLAVSTDAQCFYTLDGTDPKKNGRLYTDEIQLPEGKTTVRAVAMNDYNIYSEETTETYTITLQAPEAPKVSPASGSYDEPEEITIDVPDGCVAYYTWDGSTPTANSEKYTGPIEMIEGNNILSVILMNEHNMVSDVARYNFIYLPIDQNDEDSTNEG